jgi:phosphoribosylformimino-5-aminoimidazole carboxamide ribotide isomerase
MRVIPVLDLMRGRAVWAVRGVREAYRPARSTLVPGDGDALALARAFHDALRCEELYVADLDAIGGGAPQHDLLRTLSVMGMSLLVDAGVVTLRDARSAAAAGAARVVVGLETLDSFRALATIVEALGPGRVMFSLDLREGEPVVPRTWSGGRAPLTLAGDAVRAGVGAVLVLDLARVGTGAGVDLGLLSAVRDAHPGLELLAGGGVGSSGDLERMAAVGCDAVLVASALHDGRLDAESLDVARGAGARRRRHEKDSR